MPTAAHRRTPHGTRRAAWPARTPQVDQQMLEPRHPTPLRRRVGEQLGELPFVLPRLRSMIEYQRHDQRQPALVLVRLPPPLPDLYTTCRAVGSGPRSHSVPGDAHASRAVAERRPQCASCTALSACCFRPAATIRPAGRDRRRSVAVAFLRLVAGRGVIGRRPIAERLHLHRHRSVELARLPELGLLVGQAPFQRRAGGGRQRHAAAPGGLSESAAPRTCG